MTDLYNAVAPYFLCETLLRKTEPERLMLLAVPDAVLQALFRNDVGELLVQNGTLRVVGYSPAAAELTQWLPQ